MLTNATLMSRVLVTPAEMKASQVIYNDLIIQDVPKWREGGGG